MSSLRNSLFVALASLAGAGGLWAQGGGDAAPAAPLSALQSFEMGRSLIDQEYYTEALPYLQQIKEDDALYPYAAKAIIYCAWECPDIDLRQSLEQYASSKDASIARLAQAALLEDKLYHDELPETAQDELKSLIEQETDDDTRHALALLQIDILRLQGKYDAALQYGRELENNKKLPENVRHRVHLKLAHVFYTQAKAKPQEVLEEEQTQIAAPVAEEDVRGMGEETLLQFMASYPDSLLMEGAMNELYLHGAFDVNSYAQEALESWILPDELANSRRAALSLRSLFYIKDRNRKSTQAPDLMYVNTALAACPKEPATQDLLKETVRRLLVASDTVNAERYLQLVTDKDVIYQFLSASLFAFKKSYAEALPLFKESLLHSSGELYASALNNAFVCALNLGDETEADLLINQAKTPEQKARLYNTRIAFYARSKPSQAKADAQFICEHYPHAPYLQNAQLDLVEIALNESVELALAKLNKLNIESINQWSDAQVARYYALQIKIAQMASERHLAGSKSPLAVTRDILKQQLSPSNRLTIVFHLCYLLMEDGEYQQVLDELVCFLPQISDREDKAKVLLLAGIAAEQLNNLSALQRAIQFYQESAELSKIEQDMPLIRAAALQTRLGKHLEAQAILTNLLKKDDLEVSEKCLILGSLADVWSNCAGNDQIAIDESLFYCQQMTDLEDLPTDWYKRAHLQHAIISARYGKTAEAIKHYQAVIEANKKPSIFYSRADWYLSYSAATGLIMTYYKEKMFDQAIEMAERIAEMEGGSQQNRFSKWAAFIRKVQSEQPSAGASGVPQAGDAA